MLAADFALGEALWSILVIGLFVIWIWLLITVFGDLLFRDHETSGVGKFAWAAFIIIFPYLGIFVYLLVRGGGMAERSLKAQQQAQDQFDSYVRETAGGGGPASEVAQAKSLLDAGTITQEEFEALKAKALS
ncbi:MAG: PLDc N-terminal domain-containing protein [Actinomycetota bacterium]